MSGANYDNGRLLALKMVNNQKPDDYAHSPGSCPVNKKKLNTKGYTMKQMLPRPTISSMKRLELSEVVKVCIIQHITHIYVIV